MTATAHLVLRLRTRDLSGSEFCDFSAQKIVEQADWIALPREEMIRRLAQREIVAKFGINTPDLSGICNDSLLD